MTTTRLFDRASIRGWLIATVGVLIAALLMVGATPAQAAPVPVWPENEPYPMQSVLDPGDFLEAGVYDDGEYYEQGYYFNVVFPYTEKFDCAPASSLDSPLITWELVNHPGNRIAFASTIDSEWDPYETLFVRIDMALVASPVSGTMQAECTHSDGTDSRPLGEFPLTITPDAHPLYSWLYPWNVYNFNAGQRTTVLAMGFTPGESVNVSLVDPDGSEPVSVAGVVVTADGAGAIRTELAFPPGQGNGETIAVIAAGTTSRHVMKTWWDLENYSEVGDFSATTVSMSSSTTGKGIRAQMVGYTPNTTVLVALHSAGAPVTLGTLSIGSSGSGAATFALPRELTASDVVFAGVKSGPEDYLMAAVPAFFADISPVQGSPRYSAFANEISWMANQKISTGYDAPAATHDYRPYGSVTRDAMAAFLYRAAGSPAFTPPAKSPFVDVPTTHPFYKEITWLANKKISEGWAVASGKKEYRPGLNITRDAMAVFLYRYAGKPAFTPPATSQFVDVPTSNGFYREIAWMASTGVTTGWDAGGGRKEFRPYNSITRDAMAAFLFRFDALP